MVKLDALIAMQWPSFTVFAVLAGLALLAATNETAPGCTGPAVSQCDYVKTAKAAVDTSSHHPFTRDRGFEVFDQGSSVLVQQVDPFGPGWLSHASSVLIDKKSCRPCLVGYSYPEPAGPEDISRGPLIQRTPAEDPIAEANLIEEIRMIEAGERGMLAAAAIDGGSRF